MKCANCDRPALFIYEGSGIRTVGYCNSHLPRFLQGRAKDGSLNTTASYAREVESALSALAPASTYTVDVEPVPAEPDPEVPTVSVAPPPRKRRSKAKPKTEPEAEPTTEDAEPAAEVEVEQAAETSED